MKIVETKEFASILNIPSNQISIYLKRHKIVATKTIGEGRKRKVLFDIDDPVNKNFILSRQVFNAKKEIEEINNITVPSDFSDDREDVYKTDEAKRLKITPENSETDLPDNKENQEPEEKISLVELDRRLKQAELKLRKQKQVINTLTIEKAKGRLIPTDIVGRSTSEVILRYKTTMVQRIDQLIRDTLNSIQVDNKLLIATLSRLTDIANETSQRADEEAKIAIENSISDSISLLK